MRLKMKFLKMARDFIYTNTSPSIRSVLYNIVALMFQLISFALRSVHEELTCKMVLCCLYAVNDGTFERSEPKPWA